MAERTPEQAVRQTEENFLKTILMLQRRQGSVTASDLEATLSYKTSTIYNIVNKLDSEGYIIATRGTRGKKPSITLTQQGDEIAQRIFQRHQKIQDWLMLLGTPEEAAESEACLLEHGLSDITMGIITRHVDMAKSNFGSQAPYPEKMKQMAQAMAQLQEHKTGATETDKMVGAITKYGGYETLIKQAQVLSDLGGEDTLRQTLQAIDDLGGLHTIQKQAQALSQLGGLSAIEQTLSILETMGGVDGLYRLNDTIAQLGGLKRLASTMELYEQFGNPKKTKEILSTLSALEQLGGLKEVNRKLKAIDSLGGIHAIVNTYKKIDKLQKILEDC